MYRVIEQPTTEPVSLDEAKNQATVLHGADDDLITGLIQVAREHAEEITKRSLAPKTIQLSLDQFTSKIELKYSPLISVESVKYIDGDDVEQTLDPSLYTVKDGLIPLLLPAYGTMWPMTRPVPDAVTIVYRAGFGENEALPKTVKQWMLIRIASLYANREETYIGTGKPIKMPHSSVDSLLDGIKVRSGF